MDTGGVAATADGFPGVGVAILTDCHPWWFSKAQTKSARDSSFLEDFEGNMVMERCFSLEVGVLGAIKEEFSGAYMFSGFAKKTSVVVDVNEGVNE